MPDPKHDLRLTGLLLLPIRLHMLPDQDRFRMFGHMLLLPDLLHPAVHLP
jgi:hypothetical protein